MKKIIVFLLVAECISISNLSFAQNQSYKMEGTNPKKIDWNKLYVENTEIFPFDKNINRLYGIAVNATIQVLDQNNYYVRLILVAEDAIEHLMYESNDLLEEDETVNVSELCEETCILKGIRPRSVKIELENAEINIGSFSYATGVKNGFDIEKAWKEKKLERDQGKIEKINNSLKSKGQHWVAGPTSVSELSYSDRKKLYGQSTFPSGFEYYCGGIISTGYNSSESSALKSASATSPYIDEWDWRNRHGRNWITPVTNQGGCGSCWAFASTGSTEAMVNLFFNQIVNLNLSEQDVLSCSGGGSCNGGYPGTALDYITKTGVVDEAAFPYNAMDQSCTNKGSYPSETIKIGGKIDFGSSTYPKTEDDLKRMLIKMGPVSGGLYDWSHAMVLAGYKVVKEGDKFYYRDLNLTRSWKTVASGDPLIGKTVWIFKNSWGISFGDAGYVYVETPITNFGWTHALKTPVTSVIKKYEVVCEDRDGDGYYWWGLGPKPATCTGPDQPDGDDSDPTLGPLDQYGYCIKLGGIPVANFSADKTVVTTGGTVTFSDLSTNNPTSWTWTFAGGTPATSTTKNPVVTYSTAGTFKVILTATNSSGSDTKTVENYIQVNEPVLAPVADFVAAKTNVFVGENVQFTDLSTNQPTQWQWSFPGGNPSSSTAQNPVVAYNSAGTFDVTLTASNPGVNPSVKIKTKYIITVQNAPVDYCVPLAINSSPDFIQSVIITKVFSNTTTGNGYSLSSNVIALVPGNSYSISLTPKISTNRNYWKLWIDFNGDKDFDDAGETMIALNNKKGTIKSTLTIPQNASGTTRMRIAMRTGSTMTACDGNYNGEVEDYNVSFGAAASAMAGETATLADSKASGLFKVYPNPVNNTLNILIESVNQGDFYSIYNVNGAKVTSGTITNSMTQVGFINFSPGVYLLVIVNGEQVFNEKVIKR